MLTLLKPLRLKTSSARQHGIHRGEPEEFSEPLSTSKWISLAQWLINFANSSILDVAVGYSYNDSYHQPLVSMQMYHPWR